MLRCLDIRDMLIIERLTLDFHSGLNVLTGETGAGKSILLDALGFVLGWRGRADLVREGATQGEVTAEFELTDDHPAHGVLQDAGIQLDDGTLILRRVTTGAGRKTAFINDRRASGDLLRALSDTLVELHGQHDDRGLLNPRGHRAVLDEFAGHGPAQVATRHAWRALRTAQAALAQAQTEAEAMRAEEEFLRHAASELAALDPQPGEDEALDRARRMMQAGEKIGEDITKAAQALGSSGAEDNVITALQWLEGAAERAEGALDDAIAAVGRALAELGDAQGLVDGALGGLAFNPAELENTEERLFAIRAAARKYNVLPDDLAAHSTKMAADVARLEASEGDIAGLQKAVEGAQARYDKAASALSKSRAKAAKALDKAVMAELAPLKMERAVFTTLLDPVEPGPDGTDKVAFSVATNPGAPSGPLDKIASGGELSRFLLALKVCLSAGQTGLTMIFDEIDRGVGGATADAVGRRLADLAQGAQVLVVTHSPQVAARGAHHWQVSKQVVSGRTLSNVVELPPDERVDEIARMLAGDTVTPAARSAAKALLDA